MFYDGFGNPISNANEHSFFDISYPSYTNLFDPTKYTPDKIMNNYGTSENTVSFPGAYLTDLIDVSGHIGEYVYSQVGIRSDANPVAAYNAQLHFHRLNFYDRNNSQISYINGADVSYAPQQVPVGAAYMRISFCLRYGSTPTHPVEDFFYCFAKDDSASVIPFERYYSQGEVKTAYLKHGNLTYCDKPSHQGKRWLLFGDSLTDSYGGHSWDASTSPVGGDGWRETTERVPWTGHFWASRIARELGLTIDNRAESGSNINIGNNGNYADVCGIHILNAFLAEMDAGAQAPDYITIGFGSNAIESQLGTADSTSADTGTVCGAVKYFIEQLRAKCPNAVIGFVLPPQSDWGDTSTVKSVEKGRSAIKSVLELEEYSVPYVDMWKESGITADMLPDGIHVSSKQANNLYYHAMRRFMLGL